MRVGIWRVQARRRVQGADGTEQHARRGERHRVLVMVVAPLGQPARTHVRRRMSLGTIHAVVLPVHRVAQPDPLAVVAHRILGIVDGHAVLQHTDVAQRRFHRGARSGLWVARDPEDVPVVPGQRRIAVQERTGGIVRNARCGYVDVDRIVLNGLHVGQRGHGLGRAAPLHVVAAGLPAVERPTGDLGALGLERSDEEGKDS